MTLQSIAIPVLKIKKNTIEVLLILLFSSFVFSISAQARMVYSTTFDGWENCKNSNGIWREFANDCSDSCQYKLGEIALCSPTITYSCDCGKGRCLNEGSCIAIKDYQAMVDERNKADDRKKEDEKQEEKIRKQRAAARQSNINQIINNLIEKKRQQLNVGAPAADSGFLLGQQQQVQPVSSSNILQFYEFSNLNGKSFVTQVKPNFSSAANSNKNGQIEFVSNNAAPEKSTLPEINKLQDNAAENNKTQQTKNDLAPKDVDSGTIISGKNNNNQKTNAQNTNIPNDSENKMQSPTPVALAKQNANQENQQKGDSEDDIMNSIKKSIAQALKQEQQTSNTNEQKPITINSTTTRDQNAYQAGQRNLLLKQQETIKKGEKDSEKLPDLPPL